jgi:hypothetical protein
MLAGDSLSYAFVSPKCVEPVDGFEPIFEFSPSLPTIFIGGLGYIWLP